MKNYKAFCPKCGKELPKNKIVRNACWNEVKCECGNDYTYRWTYMNDIGECKIMYGDIVRN